MTQPKRARPACVLGAIGLVVGLIGVVIVCGSIKSMCSSIVTPDPTAKAKQGAARNAERNRKQRAEAEELAKARQVQVEREKAEAERTLAERKAFVAEYATMTPQQRAAAVKDICAPDSKCHPTRIECLLEAAATEPERKALRRSIARAQKLYYQAKKQRHAQKGRENRVSYAHAYETNLLNLRMNPEFVEARGKQKDVLYVRGWFCTRQYIYDAQNGMIGQEARALGFKQIKCSSGFDSWWGDL